MVDNSKAAAIVRSVSLERRLNYRSLLLVGSAAMLALAHGNAWADEQAADAPAATAGGGVQQEEIIVTATRRAEDIRRVPITVTAYSQAQMDVQGIKEIDDLTRLTPDIQFTHTTGSAGNNVSDISIRGIFSDVGAATTGIYIDDTPVQTRNIGYFSSNPYPKIFDLERVEVLRGPQGTLFGAGAEGGAVRFLTPQPNLEDFSGYFRSEIADTVGGDPSYEAGLAVGGPIIKDVLGFRASGWGRNDGGYIDRVGYGADNMTPSTGRVIDSNTNYDVSGVATLAFAYAPTDQLKITPSIYVQNIYYHDRDQYWSTLSNPNGDQFAQAARVGQPARDNFGLPALKIQYDFDDISVISNTSYFWRKQTETLDYSNYLGGLIYGDSTFFPPGDIPSIAYLDVNQRTITQEVRAQSNNKDDFVNWTAGVFYSWAKQSQQSLFGNGQSFFAGELIDGFYGQRQWIDGYDEQIAGYGNIDVNVYDGLKLSAGLRVSDTKYNFVYNADGVINGGTTHAAGSQDENPVTPKFGISYQIDPQNFIYATASKGFRPGGAQEAISADLCKSDLASLGYDTNGTPLTYKSDSVWSYEAGSKSAFFDGRLRVDSSVYVIDWSNIQQNVRLPTCGFAFVTNLGSATSVGGDLSMKVLVTEALSLGVNAGYNSTTLDQGKQIKNDILFEAGDRIGGPPFSASVFGQYDFSLFADADAYYRTDYTFHSRTPSIDARTFSYVPGIDGAPAIGYLSMRVGVKMDGWDVSAFVNNLTNAEQYLSKSKDIPTSPIYYLQSYRPTTAGITAVYKFGGPSEEAPPAPAAYVAPPPVAPAAVAHSYMVFFDFNKSDLTMDAVKVVAQAAANAGPAKATEITVTGHTDTVGSDAYNMRLSKRRAESVAAQLEKDGIPSSEIEIVAKGKHDLLVPTKDGVKEPQNRRVTIVYGGPTA